MIDDRDPLTVSVTEANSRTTEYTRPLLFDCDLNTHENKTLTLTLMLGLARF